MTDMEKHDQKLDAFFDAGRAEAPVPSEALIARILADADAEQTRVRPSAPRGGSVLSGLWSAIGGWRGAAGMGFAGLVGLWVGYAAPTVFDPASPILGGFAYEVADLALTADDIWDGG